VTRDAFEETFQKHFNLFFLEFLTTGTAQAIDSAPLPRIIQLGVTPEEVLKVLFKPRTALPQHMMELQRFLQGI